MDTTINTHGLKSAASFVMICLGYFSALIAVLIDAPTTVAPLFSPIIILLTMFVYQKFPFGKFIFFFYFYFLYWFVFSIASAMISQRPEHLLQIGSSSLLPVAYFLIGYHCSARFLKNSVIIIFWCTFLFTLAERFAFISGYDFLNILNISNKIRSFELLSSGDVKVGRATGFFSNSNTLGLVGGMMGFFLLFLNIRDGSARMLYLSASFVLVLLSGSKASVASFILAMVFLLPILFSRKRLISSLALFFIAGAAYFLLFQEFSTFFESRFSLSAVSETGSLGGRVLMWKGVFNYNNLTFGTIAPPEGVLGHPIDNFYFRVLAQAGILGFLITFLFFFYLIFGVVKLPEKTNRFSAMAFVVFFSLNSLTTLGYLVVEAGMLFGLAVGQFAQCRCSIPPSSTANRLSD